MSDTHTYGKRVVVPDGDILVHAGDHTFRGTDSETKAALTWLESLPHKHKVIVAGNHDFFFDRGAPGHYRNWSLTRYHTIDGMLAKFPAITYLENSGAEIEGLKFWGSPWTPWFYDWAFNFPYRNGEQTAKATWAKIPYDTQVLVTHGPPYGIRAAAYADPGDHRTGCPELRARIEELPNLRLHVFGHIHEQYGVTKQETGMGNPVTFVNAAINTRDYEPTNPPIIIDL